MIRSALSFKQIDVTELKSDEKFLEQVNEKAKIYYANHADTRDFAAVLKSTLIGELGEYGIYEECKRCNLYVIHNDENISKEFYWDLAIEEALCEVKFKGNNDPFNFSFSNKLKDDEMFKKWKLYDLIISFYIKKLGDRTFIIPWLLISNQAIDQNLLHRDGLPFYRDSVKDEGRYLRQEAEEAGLFIRLNDNQKAFTFE